jgi:hypothetical protein
LMILGLAISSGCTPKLIAVKTDPCAGWAPILISKQDVLTDGTAKQILSHDMHGKKVCGWVNSKK